MLLAAMALAHVPHDPVIGVIPPAEGGAWFVMVNSEGDFSWLRSTDDAATWNITVAEPAQDEVRDAARCGADLCVLSSNRLWWTGDEGASWTTEPLPGDVSQAEAGETLTLAGGGGLWTGGPGAFTQAIAEPILTLGPGAAASATEVWVAREGWSVLGPKPDASVTAVAANEEEAYVGTADGRLYRWDGAAWGGCAPLPTELAEHNDIVRIHPGFPLLVATGDSGPFAALPDCSAWADRTGGDRVSYGTGGATVDVNAYSNLDIVDGTWILTGWQGLRLSRDEGETWEEPYLLPPDYARGFALQHGWPGEPRVYVGAYGSAVQYTDDGGLTWGTSVVGLRGTDVQAVRAHPLDPLTVYAVVQHLGWRSTDGGESWEEIGPAGNMVDQVYAWDNGNKIWLIGSAISESTDDGATWTDRDDLEDVLGTSFVSGLIETESVVYIILEQPSGLAESTDGGLTFVRTTTGGAVQASGFAQVVSNTERWLLWGDVQGVHREPLTGGEESVVAMPEVVAQLASVADGTAWALTRGGALLRSEDLGLTWTSVGERLPGAAHALFAHQDGDGGYHLFAATAAGLFVGDGEGAWSKIAYQRVDDISGNFTCEGCSAREEEEGAALTSITPLGDVGRMTVQIHGSTLRITGDGEGAELWIDGVSHGIVSTDRTLLAHVRGLADGWHKVELVGIVGNTVRVDHLEAWGSYRPFTLDEPEAVTDSAEPEADEEAPAGTETDACGCGDGRVAAVLPLLFWRRRRR